MATMKKTTSAKPVKAVKRATAVKPVPLGTPSPKPAGRRPAPRPVVATKKPLTASEKAFIKNQKEKAKATKRTGVYPNTAN